MLFHIEGDEAEAIEALGLKPKLVTGELRNLKVTYPQDLAVLAALLNANERPSERLNEILSNEILGNEILSEVGDK